MIETAALEVIGLSAGYGARTVIQDLNLAPLQAGQVLSLLGPNAAGKSTLLRALAGLHPAQGVVRLGELELNRLSLAERARLVTYMPQTLPQGVALTVLETLISALRASPSGDAPDGRGDEADQALAVLTRLDLQGLALRRLDELSGGQRQLASLAQAVVRSPRVLLLDEPTSALDLRHQLRVLNLVRELARERGMRVVIVLHDLQAAARVSDQIAVLNKGRIATSGSPEAAITPAMLAEVYQVRARVERCGLGQLQVMVDDVL